MVKPVILIADDDKAIRLVLERKFNKSGFITKSTDKGKNLFNTSACMTELVSRDRGCPRLRPDQTVPATLANLFTGKLKTRESLCQSSDLNLINQLCNLFSISCLSLIHI